jgi:hypothetical protein
MAKKQTAHWIKANVHWSTAVRERMCILDRGSHFVAVSKRGKKAVVNWSSVDARDAQNELKRRAQTRAYCPAGLSGARRKKRRK